MKILSREDIDQMSDAEKLELIDELWDSLEDKAFPLTPEQMAELDRRMETFGEDVKHAITWDELEAKLIAREK
jgi:putative addiction module component (TIGR02574 family)